MKKRALRAGMWSLGGHVSGQVIRLASNLIMTRLLVPEMFGVMAIASMVLMGMALFSDFGTNQSVIQSARGDQPEFLNTVWVVQIIRGALIFVMGLLLSLAFYMAAKAGWVPENTVYAKPILSEVLGFVALTALIEGFQSTRRATANRRLTQGRITLIDIASQISGIVIMISWALMDRSIWALVAGGITSSLVKTIASHKVLPGEPNRWKWEKSAFFEIFHFGKWMFVSSILGFLLNNGDRLLLSSMISAKDLGIYVIAFFVINSMTQAISRIVANVAFPVLSETVRNKPSSLASIYYKFRLPLDVSLLFISGLLFEIGRYVIFFFWDARYAAAGKMLEILSLTLVAFRYSIVAGQCFLALGIPKLMVRLISVRVVALFILLPLAYKQYQMTGALWAIVVSAFSNVPLALYLKKKSGLLDIRKELNVLPVFLFGIVVGIAFKKLMT